MKWLAAVLLLAVLAGCSDGDDDGDARVRFPNPSAFGQPESMRPNVTIAVTHAEVAPGRCFDGSAAFGDECHWVTVRATNRNGAADADVNTLWWTGVDGGGVHRPVQADGPDAVAAGATAEVRVGFDFDAGTSERLDALRYGAFDTLAEAPVPAY